ncbi:MAG: leucine-rich repeat protein, partial [Clostridia bacterium]|nr:leucine-rich repeat protein [Clostridia bacterium]
NNITELTLPDSVVSVSSGAFGRCNALRTVTFGSGVKYIGKYALRECAALETINYHGTEEQWNQIEKSDFWIYDTYDVIYNFEK